MTSEVLFNLDGLRRITDGDVELEREFAGLFLTTANRCMAELEKLVADAEMQDWVRSIHQLAGAAANMHAEQLAELCRAAERAPATTDNVRRVQLAEIQAAYANLLPEIEKMAAA
jgi:HPt (histidine-containing phosphotransfer) domain-containing protein